VHDKFYQASQQTFAQRQHVPAEHQDGSLAVEPGQALRQPVAGGVVPVSQVRRSAGGVLLAAFPNSAVNRSRRIINAGAPSGSKVRHRIEHRQITGRRHVEIAFDVEDRPGEVPRQATDTELDKGARLSPAGRQHLTSGRGLAAEARSRPVTFVAFDLLHDAGGDLRNLALAHRRARLEVLLAAAPTALQVCPQTADFDEAMLWLQAYAPLGCEGLVIKDLAGRYRRTGWWKYKIKVTAEAIIGGVTGSLHDPSSLLLGRLDSRGRLRFVGHTGVLTVPQRREVAELATPDDGEHPWPLPLPAAWLGHFDRPRPLPYVPVRSLLVAEIVVDQAYESGRWRHQVRHLRLRADMNPGDVRGWSSDTP
jgi:ATP dependent DNA ligase domain